MGQNPNWLRAVERVSRDYPFPINPNFKFAILRLALTIRFLNSRIIISSWRSNLQPWLRYCPSLFLSLFETLCLVLGRVERNQAKCVKLIAQGIRFWAFYFLHFFLQTKPVLTQSTEKRGFFCLFVCFCLSSKITACLFIVLWYACGLSTSNSNLIRNTQIIGSSADLLYSNVKNLVPFMYLQFYFFSMIIKAMFGSGKKNNNKKMLDIIAKIP